VAERVDRAGEDCAVPVCTAGGPEIVNVRSAPSVVPDGFFAASRKWCVVPAVSPLIGTEAFAGFVPLPALLAGVVVV
jgi:hypothetical protein